MKFIRNTLYRIQTRTAEALSSFSDIVRQMIIWASTAIALFWLSVLIYGTFYYYYVPVVTQEKPVYFQFRVCESGVGMCSFPTANLSLGREGQSEVFKKGQVYKLILDVDLPESDTNRNLGMFMIEMSLYNKKGETVQSAAKSVSATLNYKSNLLMVLDTLVFSPFYLFGYMNQKQGLHVELFSSYKDHTYDPAVGTVFVVHSLKVEIYTATLRIFAQFSGIRYFLYYWPVTAAAIGVSWNFILLTFMALLSWYAFLSDSETDTDCKQIAKLYLPRNRKTEGSPRKARKAVLDTPATPETLGSSAGDSDGDTTSLLIPLSSAESDPNLRLRQPFSAS